MLSNTTYDRLNNAVRLILPATASAYLGLDAIWDLPAEQQVVGTLAVVATFLGVLLKVAAAKYEGDGAVVVTPQEAGPTLFSLELEGDPRGFLDRDSLTFKMKTGEPIPEDPEEHVGEG